MHNICNFKQGVSMSIISDIKNYIFFLKNKCNLQISLHPIKKENLIIPSELIAFNIHENSYCAHIKGCPEANQHCVFCQLKVLDKCLNGAFKGICYAGVSEFIYPIKNNGETVGFISVGGYKSENYKSYLKAIEKKFSLQYEKLLTAYNTLKDTLPEKTEIDTLLIPLVAMIELAYIQNQSEIKESYWFDNIVRYVIQNHTQNITIDDLVKQFYCSRSKISHTFKAKTGKTFREYLTDLRLNDALSLLKYSNLNITEIAYSIGFIDSAYFSNVFKAKVGTSPLNYRKANSQRT